MERRTFSIRFECKQQKAQKDGRAPVYAVITVNGKSERVQMDIKCYPTEFRSLERSRSDNNLRRMETKFIRDIEDIKTNLSMNGQEVTAYKIKDVYRNGYTKTSYTLQDLFNGFRKQKYEEDITPGTWKKYENAFNRFINYTGHRNEDEAVSVKHGDIQLYEAKMRRDKAETTTCKDMKNIKAFFAYGVANGKLISNPFGTIRIGHGIPENVTEYLTYNEIDILRNYKPLNERLNNVKTLFLWQCFTGQNYGDMTILTDGDVEQDENGRYYINKARYKKGKYGKQHFYHTYLFEDAVTIYKRYGCNLPLIALQNYNDYLQELIDLIPIKKKITSKSGRKSFACYLYNHLKITDLSIIKTMLGHENIRQTEEYVSVFKETVKETIQSARPETEEEKLLRATIRTN